MPGSRASVHRLESTRKRARSVRSRRGATQASRRQSGVDLAGVLRPFAEHAFPLRSVVAVGCDRFWAADTGSLRVVSRRARGRPGAAADDVLLASPRALADSIDAPGGEFTVRAVALVVPGPPDHSVWRLQRALFDRGLVGIGATPIPGGETRCFLASDAVQSLTGLGVGTRGRVAMSCLGVNGRFANQLFQYAYAKLYALRHGLSVALPAWDGRRLFELDDPPCADVALRVLQFEGFNDNDRRLWDEADPPIDVDLQGYFQEIPGCWRAHRPLIRRMFQLPAAQRQAIDLWRDAVTDGGRRTLVAVHVRRGDYREQQLQELPWFRLVPEDWYLSWLRAIWPTLRDPLLYVASDEPDVIRPAFSEFPSVQATFGGAAAALPDHVRDFEVLRRADHLALGNSSFSRMAAILAPSTQACVLPSFQTGEFEPYEPWVDPGFWARFADMSRPGRADAPPRGGRPRKRSQPRPEDGDTSRLLQAQPTTYFDVSDLLLYLRHHTSLSGIQRVQCEIMRHLVAVSGQPVRLAALDEAGGLMAVETAAVQELVEHLRAGTASRAEIAHELEVLQARAAPLFVRARDVFLMTGAFWSVGGIGLALQELKNRGVVIGVLIHDILSVSDPEYFEARGARIFNKGLVEALACADYILTTSEYNKTALTAYLATRGGPPLPVHVVPLARELPSPAPGRATVSDRVRRLADSEYVLCVGTIEVRKNPMYLFNVWRLMRQAGRTKVPTLILVGRQGWLVRDFMEQLAACKYLDGRIVVLHDVTDAELALLYRNCLLTMFPSFAEGWGLPVGESLAFGKVTLASPAGGIPEVGGELADAINPYNACDGLDRLARYLDDPALRRARERDITERFEPRAWARVADDFLKAARMLAGEAPRADGIAAMRLPPNQYLLVTSDPGGSDLDGLAGELSADLSCVSGWLRPERWGVSAGAPAAVVRFRTRFPVGTRIHVVMRLVALGAGPVALRVFSGSGGEVTVSIPAHADTVAAVSCEVEPGNLVTLRTSRARTTSSGDEDARPSWGLKGLLYFEPGQAVAASPRSVPRQAPQRGRIRIAPAAAMPENGRAASLDAFLQSAQCYWPSGLVAHRRAPIFADAADGRIFARAHGSSVGAVTDQITLMRRSDQYVSMSRFSEGSLFDRSGVTRACGYLDGSPPVSWLRREGDGLWVDETSLEAARYLPNAYAVFFNGNLHNYYHWMTEGVLSLDILRQMVGPALKLHLALPTSMDINAPFDHRASLRAVGLDMFPVEEVAADFVKVREAIWVESDLVQTMPAPFLQNFRRRVADQYAATRAARPRRLLVARRGPTRRIRNLAAVQRCLAGRGFDTVFLEGMSVADQIRLFQSAEFVIGPHGAGLANLLFCQPGTKVIELMPTAETRPFFWLISEKLDLVHGMLFCRPAAGAGFQADLNVNVRKLRTLVEMLDASR